MSRAGELKAGRALAAAVAFLALVAHLSLAAPTALAAPANDYFADRTQLNGSLPIAVSGTTEAATAEEGEPEDWFSPDPAGHSVWFEWKPTSTEFVTVSVCNSQIPAMVGIFAGAAMDELHREIRGYAAEGPNPGCKAGEREYSFKAVTGTSYKIAVDGNSFVWDPDAPPDTEGPFSLRIESLPPPVNDDFDNALPLELDTVYTGSPSEPFQTSARSGHNWGATKEPGEPNHGGNPGGASVWFTWTAPATGTVEFNVCCFTLEVLAIYTGDSVGSLTQVAGGHSFQVAQVAEGVTYRIAVDGELLGPEIGSRTGSFNVSTHMRLPPPVAPVAPDVSDTTPPQTLFAVRKVRAKKRRASFSLGSTEPGVRFLCQLDKRPPVICGRRVTYKNLKPGRHLLSVTAVDAAGNADPTPATARFWIPIAQGRHRAR